MVVGKQSSEIAGKGAKFFGCGFLTGASFGMQRRKGVLDRS
ncbi:hypothetical protein SAMN05660909_01364, partial [Chitinophaga terrae (ex Kim and Jung 2007)]